MQVSSTTIITTTAASTSFTFTVVADAVAVSNTVVTAVHVFRRASRTTQHVASLYDAIAVNCSTASTATNTTNAASASDRTMSTFVVALEFADKCAEDMRIFLTNVFNGTLLA